MPKYNVSVTCLAGVIRLKEIGSGTPRFFAYSFSSSGREKYAARCVLPAPQSPWKQAASLLGVLASMLVRRFSTSFLSLVRSAQMSTPGFGAVPKGLSLKKNFAKALVDMSKFS